MPLRVKPSSLSYMKSHPNADELRQVLLQCKPETQNDISCLVSLWLTEGIPSVFSVQPGLYAKLRETIGKALSIQDKDISLAGSARFGYSLKPSQYGTTFSEHSDLDFFIINNHTFETIKNEASSYISHIKSLPDPLPREEDAIRSLVNTLPRGFIDEIQIASNNNYPLASKLKRISAHSIKSLSQTPGGFSVKRSNFRIYRDWTAANDQVTLNISNLIKKLKEEQAVVRP